MKMNFRMKMNVEKDQHFSKISLLPALTIGIIIVLLYILSSVSQTCKYYIRMTLLPACYILASMLAIPGSIVTFFQNGGGYLSLRMVEFCCRWLDMDIEIRGTEKIEAASGPEHKPLVLISNHQSSLDLYVMAVVQPKKTTAMMKNSLKYVPFFNLAAILSNSIFVNRYNKERAHLVIKEAVSTMLKKRLKIWMFPEGTRNHDGGMLTFKKGAFNIAIEAQIDVVPIVFSDYAPFYSKTDRYFHDNGKVIAEVMDPIPTSGTLNDDYLLLGTFEHFERFQLKSEDAAELCERIRNDMLQVYKKISAEAKERYEKTVLKKAE